MLTSIQVKSALFLGLFLGSSIVGNSDSSFKTASTYPLCHTLIEKKIQDPVYLKKVIDDFFGENSPSAHAYQSVFLNIKHPQQRPFLANDVCIQKNRLALIGNITFQKAAIHYFLTNKDYKPYGWRVLVDTPLITQPEIRKTILQEIQKVLRRPAQPSAQFMDSLNHVIKVTKNNNDVALLNDIKEIIEKSKITDKENLLKNILE